MEFTLVGLFEKDLGINFRLEYEDFGFLQGKELQIPSRFPDTSVRILHHLGARGIIAAYEDNTPVFVYHLTDDKIESRKIEIQILFAEKDLDKAISIVAKNRDLEPLNFVEAIWWVDTLKEYSYTREADSVEQHLFPRSAG